MFGPQLFCPFTYRSHTMFGTWVYHHVTMCHVHSWPLYELGPQYQNHIFINLSLARLSARWHRHLAYGFTFLTFVWSWHLTYMWVVGGILSEFYSQFLSCSFQSFIDWRLAALTRSFFKQSIFKQLLTEGIKFLYLHNKISCQYLWSVHTMNNFF